MKKISFAAFLVLVIVAAGCVSTVNDRKTAAVPLVKDRVEAKYPRTVDQVLAAARDVVSRNGTVTREGTLLGQTNNVRTLEGKVNQRTVWVRVESVEPNITACIVQVRTSGGGTDKPLTYQLDKEIAIRLTTP